MCNLQDWTSLGGDKNATDYVPTILGYEKKHNLQYDAPSQVGFIEDYLRHDLRIYEWFKEHFPDNLPSASEEPGAAKKASSAHFSSTDTVILYRNFLTKLYVAIKSVGSDLLKGGPSWDKARIEFIFSVPATWNRLTETLDNITEGFRTLVKEVGFGQGNPQHRVMIGLTEPEAAAAFCLSSKDDSDYIQVCLHVPGDTWVSETDEMLSL